MFLVMDGNLKWRKMKIKKQLEDLLYYYMATRATGHTTLLKKGTDNYDKPYCVLTHDTQAGDTLGFNQKNLVTLNSLDRLRGSSRPLAIDNGAMTELLISAIMRIENLEEENKKLIKDRKKIYIRK